LLIAMFSVDGYDTVPSNVTSQRGVMSSAVNKHANGNANKNRICNERRQTGASPRKNPLLFHWWVNHTQSGVATSNNLRKRGKPPQLGAICSSKTGLRFTVTVSNTAVFTLPL